MTKKTQKTEAAEYVDPETLVPWEDNPRDNTAAVYDVMESIREFGFSSPIVARSETRQIIAGHTRWKAAKELGLTQVPVRFLDISEEKAKRLAIADNKIGELATWDDAKLVEVLESIQREIEGYDFSILGFDESEIDSMLASDVPLGDSDDEVFGNGAVAPDDDAVGTIKIIIEVPVEAGSDASNAIQNGLESAGFSDEMYKMKFV